MASWLARTFGRKKNADPAALEAFLERHAAFIAQKTAVDYCRVKAGRQEREMFADADFLTALTHCRWQTFAPSVADVLAMAEAWLRPEAGRHGGEAALASALARMGTAILDRAAAPPAERATLDGVRDGLERNLALLQQAPPLGADRLPMQAEAPLLATIPIHPDQRAGETPSIRGALRFHLVSAQQEMERFFDPAELAVQLAAQLAAPLATRLAAGK
jgi:hypothetical protein